MSVVASMAKDDSVAVVPTVTTNDPQINQPSSYLIRPNYKQK